MSWAHDVSLASRMMLGTVFAVSVFSKVRSQAAWRSFRSWLMSLPLAPLRWRPAPLVLAAVEFAVLVLLAVPAAALTGLVAGSLLCLSLTVGLMLAERRWARQPCNCFGASSEPLGHHQVVRNALLLSVALAGLVCGVAASRQLTAGAATALVLLGGLASALLVLFSTDIAALLSPAAHAESGSAAAAGSPGLR
jgi:hypothetical protein